ncbi:MAG TPA: response regulator, partial [Anaerolineales bacterium]|nr:response regulator [Anaerolineales bacterium]
MSSIILIVDDEPAGRQTLESILEGQGYRLEMAENGLEALEKAGQLLPDVILLDVMMPGMDGFEVCRRIRSNPALAEIPIIFLTALDDRQSLLDGLASGADDYITKPYDRFELRARLLGITRLNRY